MKKENKIQQKFRHLLSFLRVIVKLQAKLSLVKYGSTLITLVI